MQRHLFLFSPIDDYAAQYVISELFYLDRESNEEITIFINSGGGSVYAMFSIIDAMNAIKSPVRTVVMGIAASAAAVIASNGDKRLISENSKMMIHEVWSIVGGKMSELEEDIAEMSKDQQKLINILASKSNKTPEQIAKMIKKEDKWFDAKEAVKIGLADEVIKNGSAQIIKLSEGVNIESSEIKESTVQMLREGSFQHPTFGKIVINQKVLEQIKSNFDNKVRGIDISIDYTHDNDNGEKRAACWVKSLEINDTDKGLALFANVEFTPAGKQLVAEKEFKYVSADFVIDYVNESGNHIPYVLRGGTLTNKPFIKEMNPIKLSELQTIKKELIKMDKEALLNSLKEQFKLDVPALEASIQTLTDRNKKLENSIKELSEIPVQKDEEIAELKNQLDQVNKEIVDAEKKAAFNTLIDSGKVTPAQEEKILALFDSAEKILDFYKDSPEVVKTKQKGSSASNSNGLTQAEQLLVDNGTYTAEQILENRKIK